jgi:hypothetical protein
MFVALFLKVVEEVESPNSQPFGEKELHEMPSN